MGKILSGRARKVAIVGALMCSALLGQSHAVADFKRPTAFKCVAYNNDWQMSQTHFAVEATNAIDAMSLARERAREMGPGWTVHSCGKV